MLPIEVIPILEKVMLSKLTPHDLPIEVWTYPNHLHWVDIFLEFGTELFNSGLDFSKLPAGYGMVSYIFDWEVQNQFSGWYALENRAYCINEICSSYAAAGFPREASGISNAFQVWDRELQNYDQVSKAYLKEKPEFESDIVRMENLVCFFIDNANALFYRK